MSDEERLADLLLAWEERFEQGDDLSASELCSICPELAPLLSDQIQSLKKLAWLKSPSNEVGGISVATSASTGPNLPPTLDGRYRLDDRIAEGGFGEVWRGYDSELQRSVAIKVPKRHRLAPPVEKFLEEARKLAQLRHPGIVAVHDVGKCDGTYFIISDLIEGNDLGKRLRSEEFSPPEVARIVSDVARHLHHAHQQGYIHRDIKPANILLSDNGEAFITDFGIAVTGEELRQGGDDCCGTLAYMSPEQLQGDPSRIDFRTDIYSMGIVLFQLLTKRLPFEAVTPEGVRYKILSHDSPSPRGIEPNIPKALEGICLKCIAKDPANRYQTAEELANELKRWLNRRRTNRILVGIGLVFCILVPWFVVAGPFRLLSDQESNLRLAINPSKHLVNDERELFNGRDLDGWDFTSQVFIEDGIEKKARSEDVLRIVDGVLVCDEVRQYRVTTLDKYKDFVLKLDCRFPHDARFSTGSAVLLRVSKPNSRGNPHVRVRLGGWQPGRIVPALTHLPQMPADFVKQPVRPGRVESERPVGEWNAYEITCVGGAIAVKLNGVPLYHENVSMAEHGAIGLAPQGCAIEFRNVKLTPLGK